MIEHFCFYFDRGRLVFSATYKIEELNSSQERYCPSLKHLLKSFQIDKMLDLMTCTILSAATLTSLLVMVIGSTHRMRKMVLTYPKIILPKSEMLEMHKPFWQAHRAFQMRRLSQVNVDIVGKANSLIEIKKEGQNKGPNYRKLSDCGSLCSFSTLDIPKETPV